MKLKKLKKLQKKYLKKYEKITKKIHAKEAHLRANSRGPDISSERIKSILDSMFSDRTRIMSDRFLFGGLWSNNPKPNVLDDSEITFGGKDKNDER